MNPLLPACGRAPSEGAIAVAPVESNAGASGEQAIESAADDEPLMTGAGDGIPYIQAVQDESGNAVLGKDGELTWETKTYDGEWSRPGTSMSNGWYYVESSILEQNVINVEGDVHIILGDGCELAAHDGIYIHDGATLTVYGQSVGASRVFGWGDSETDSAGIGGRMDARGGNLVTHGVNVEGRGKDGGADIGGGAGEGSGYGNMTFFGGTIRGKADSDGAGIGWRRRGERLRGDHIRRQGNGHWWRRGGRHRRRRELRRRLRHDFEGCAQSRGDRWQG